MIIHTRVELNHSILELILTQFLLQRYVKWMEPILFYSRMSQHSHITRQGIDIIYIIGLKKPSIVKNSRLLTALVSERLVRYDQ